MTKYANFRLFLITEGIETYIQNTRNRGPGTTFIDLVELDLSKSDFDC